MQRGAWWFLLSAVGCTWAHADTVALPTQQDSRIVEVFHADRVWNAITTTTDGRVFVGFPQADRPGIQVEELDAGGNGKPYPDAVWNSGARGAVAHHFLLINSIRIGPDGDLWLVDAGAPGIGKPAVKGGARLFRIDLKTNSVARIYPLASVAGLKSFVDDVRFHGHFAYLTDAGMPGLIILDLSTGTAWRALDKEPSTVDRRPLYADGKMLIGKAGKQFVAHADQLEISPDGATLYYQPASGPMSRIATRWFEDLTAPPRGLESHVEAFADTPTTGGTAIDAQGNIYDSDSNRRCILRITPKGEISTLVCDPRLVWTDAMWVDKDGFLWMPAAQLNLTPGMNGGTNAVVYPVHIYKMKIGIGPSPIDHP